VTAGRQQWLAQVATAALASGALPSLAALRQAQPRLRSVSMKPWPAGGHFAVARQVRFTASFTDNDSRALTLPASWK
jgi:hypothetical protein